MHGANIVQNLKTLTPLAKDMENDKTRFFALHLNSDVEYTFNEYEGSHLSYTGRHISKLVGVTCYNDYEMLVDTGTELYPASEPENPVLLLKPLSEISDEDGVEVAKIFNSKNIKRTPEYIVLNKDNNTWLWFDGEILSDSRVDQQPLQLLEAYDFLRSKSYLLPFGKYTTDQLISMGWAKN